LANYENRQFPPSKEAKLMEMISSKEADKSSQSTAELETLESGEVFDFSRRVCGLSSTN
jgi:hypothetical protein